MGLISSVQSLTFETKFFQLQGKLVDHSAAGTGLISISGQTLRHVFDK